MSTIMAGHGEERAADERRRCPRCKVCGVVVRLQGVGRDGVWCRQCIGQALPFTGIVAESDFKGYKIEPGTFWV